MAVGGSVRLCGGSGAMMVSVVTVGGCVKPCGKSGTTSENAFKLGV